MLQQVAVIPLEDFVEKLNHVSWHRNYISASCVFHTPDDHASLLIFDDGYFKCLACGVYGNHQKLERKLSGKSVQSRPAEKSPSPPWLSWEKKYTSYEEAAIAAYNNAKSFPNLLSYLKQRKLDKFIQKGKFGWIDGWLSFPVFDPDGSMVDWVCRSHPKMKTDIRYAIRPRKNIRDNHLYCPDWTFCQKSEKVFFPFGLLDAWSVYAANFPSMTGITGQLINTELLDDIRKTIYIIPDKGEKDGAIRMREKLDWRGQILLLDYPDDAKDPQDIHRIYGLQTLRELIEKAEYETNSTNSG